MTLPWAAGISLSIVTVAWLLRALTTSGAVTAFGVGISILHFTGWPGCAILGTFFVTSSTLGRLVGTSAPSDAKGETRDSRQVLANGGVAAAVVPLELAAEGLGFWLAAVALGAAQADTWATAFGALSRRPPRDILSGEIVPPGTSGGVTWMGTSGGAIGAALLALVAATTGPLAPATVYLAVATLGFAGMLTDSVLGASVQARFRCPMCDLDTERPIHRCGSPTTRRRGWRWLDNDGVNALATGLAAAAGLAWWWLSRSA